MILVGAASLVAAEEVRPEHEVSGVGAFPLSDRVTAQWLLAPIQGARPQPLIMFYYRGSPGWHKRKWEIKSHFGKAPAVARLVSPDLELVVEYGRGVTDVKVQGQVVDFKSSNVFLVSPVGDPATKPTVEPLGFVMFKVPSDANPAEYVLETNPTIADRVMKE